MKKINLRNPLVIYCLTLASLILTIGVIYVIVDVNSKLAPDKQILFSPDEEKEREDKHFLKVIVWEQRTDVIRTHHSGYYSSEGYKETTLKKGGESSCCRGTEVLPERGKCRVSWIE